MAVGKANDASTMPGQARPHGDHGRERETSRGRETRHATARATGPGPRAARGSSETERYRHLWRQTLLRLLATYLAPLLLLSAYFHLQYRSLLETSRRSHFLAIAESQAGMLDLFLRERMVNLVNVIDDPRLPRHPSQEVMQEALSRLQRDSAAFVDLGVFDRDGSMVGYAGPFPALRKQSYRGEEWFQQLLSSGRRTIVTDLYQGFRQQPHFTIAARRSNRGVPVAVRATLDPERIHEYVRSLRGGREVQSVLVSASGRYQEVTLPEALARGTSPIVPPKDPPRGVGTLGTTRYAYCWLEETGWALLVLWNGGSAPAGLEGFDPSLLVLSVAVILVVFGVIVVRTRSMVRHQIEVDTTRQELSGQLHHAVRLASVGELAAGVAHEINNPLAIIAEEAGLMRDLMDPELSGDATRDDLRPHLQTIQEAVFRARDVTHKLLSFVRRTDVDLARHDLHALIEEAVGGLLEREMKVANIDVVRDYAPAAPPVLADRSQIEQVIVNLVTNAIDAMPNGGQLTLATTLRDGQVRFSVRDTGVGIDAASLDRIFMPFHTTKEVGKGTGLGLSVSYGIVKNHGGEILVESEAGRGTTFTVVLPLADRQEN